MQQLQGKKVNVTDDFSKHVLVNMNTGTKIY